MSETEGAELLRTALKIHASRFLCLRSENLPQRSRKAHINAPPARPALSTTPRPRHEPHGRSVGLGRPLLAARGKAAGARHPRQPALRSPAPRVSTTRRAPPRRRRSDRAGACAVRRLRDRSSAMADEELAALRQQRLAELQAKHGVRRGAPHERWGASSPVCSGRLGGARGDLRAGPGWRSCGTEAARPGCCRGSDARDGAPQRWVALISSKIFNLPVLSVTFLDYYSFLFSSRSLGY